ncbi:MAG: DUF4912 domain-containing protein [Clostridiales bacterium]|nr:DUF4912 domain-containing protein [Clostridiales bacterium]MCF8021659.1 DUF4912 domain-containing protein [Clostridiales bacterium]
MNALFFIAGISVLLALSAIYLFFKKFQKNIKEETKPQFNEEIAEELAVPIEPQKQELCEELPHNYGVDRLLLLVRDPQWLYAYWEITATKQEEFNSNYGTGTWNSSRPALRVYEIDKEPENEENYNHFTDIDINDFDDNWHINVGKANHSFCIDIGRVLPNGKFITILRSNTVTTPRENISDCLDEEWMWIEDIYKSLNKIPYGVSSPGISEKYTILPLGISSPGVNSLSQVSSEN